VKPQTGLFLDKARQQLQRADDMLGIGLNDDAGRAAYAAYLAGLRVAQASSSRSPTRHAKGFRRAARICAAGEGRSAFRPSAKGVSSADHNLKAIADYETGSAQVSAGSARNAVAAALRFVDCVPALIPPNGNTPHAADTPKL